MTCPSPTHVSLNDYQRRGCRCPRAVRAASRARRRWYARHSAKVGRVRRSPLVDGTGTRRRIEGLAVAGWGMVEVAGMLGMSSQRVLQLRTQDTLVTDVAERVAAVTARLDGMPGPNGRARGVARRRGWVPLSWWADVDDPDDKPRSPWQRFLETRPTPLLLERDVLDDQADRAVDAVLDAIDADDDAWFAAQRESRADVAA